MGSRTRATAALAVFSALALAGCANREDEGLEQEETEEWQEEVPVTDPTEANERRPFLDVADLPELGRYLRTARDQPVYLFTADSAGASTCYDACAVSWPPLVAQGEPAVEETLDGDLAGAVERRDGGPQVTYGGWPLYHFRGDTVPGRPQGQDVEEYGGEWYLVTPDGRALEHGGEDGPG